MNPLTTKHSRLAALRPLSPESVASFEDAWDVLMIYESNEIEGNSLTLREVEMVLHRGADFLGKPRADHEDVRKLFKAWELVKRFAQPEADIDEFSLREISVALGYPKHTEPEALMLRAVASIERQFGNQKQAPEFFGPLLTNLSFDPVEKAAEIHERVRKYHHFNTGTNKAYCGRLSRLAMNFVLLAANYPPISIPATRYKEYNDVLKAADSNNFQAWLDFFIRHLSEELDEKIAFLSER
jgi:Fic family protein